MSYYAILISAALMLMAYFISRKLILSMPKGDEGLVERLARVMLALGLITTASLPSASGSRWQTWTAVLLMVAAVVLWLLVFIKKRQTVLANDRAGH